MLLLSQALGYRDAFAVTVAPAVVPAGGLLTTTRQRSGCLLGWSGRSLASCSCSSSSNRGSFTLGIPRLEAFETASHADLPKVVVCC